MAKTQFTDAAGRTAFKDEGGRVFTEGGKRDTFYNVSDWNKRQLDRWGAPGSQTGGQSDLGGASAATGFSGSADVSGGSGAFPGAGGQPSIDLAKIHQESTNTPEIQGIRGEIEAKRAALTKAQSNINDNPFYSEATRLGKLSKLNQTAQSELRDLESTLSTRMADAQTKINIATKQYDIDSQQYKNNLSRLNTLISTGALSGASGNDLAQIAAATGLSSSMIQGIRSKMATSATKPYIETFTDNAGNVTIEVVDGNTGEPISQRSLGTIGKARVGAIDKTEEQREKAFYSSIDSGIGQLEGGEPWGTVWNRVRARFPEVSNEVIDTMLGKENWFGAGAFEAFKGREQRLKQSSTGTSSAFGNFDAIT